MYKYSKFVLGETNFDSHPLKSDCADAWVSNMEADE